METQEEAKETANNIFEILRQAVLLEKSHECVEKVSRIAVEAIRRDWTFEQAWEEMGKEPLDLPRDDNFKQMFEHIFIGTEMTYRAFSGPEPERCSTCGDSH